MSLKLFFKEIEDITERDDGALDVLKKRLLGAVVVVLVFFAIIVLRLWSLQITNGKEYENRAYSNRVRVREVIAPRGHILDRNGNEIVTNRPSFNVVLIQEDSHDVSDVLKRLAPVLEVDVSQLWEKIREASGTPKYLPIRLKEDIDWKTLAYLENHNQEFSGVRKPDPHRFPSTLEGRGGQEVPVQETDLKAQSIAHHPCIDCFVVDWLPIDNIQFPNFHVRHTIVRRSIIMPPML